MGVRVWRLAVLLALLPLSAARAQSGTGGGALDWGALTQEAVALLSEYIRINTTNPPGNELAGAQFLKHVLDREGIEAQ
jgi:hypothetical protein